MTTQERIAESVAKADARISEFETLLREAKEAHTVYVSTERRTHDWEYFYAAYVHARLDYGHSAEMAAQYATITTNFHSYVPS